VKILVARSSSEIETAYQKLSVSKVLGCDTETSSLSARHGRLFSVQFSDGDFNVLVPISEGIRLGRLAGILENPNIVKIFHNAKFDLEFLRENGYQVENVFCTMIAEKVLTRGAGQSSSLAETLYRYFAVDLDKSQRAKFTKNWDGVWTEELVNYALSDVVYLPELKKEQELWLERLGLKQDFAAQMQKVEK
jgi:DNA polymerase-1